MASAWLLLERHENIQQKLPNFIQGLPGRMSTELAPDQAGHLCGGKGGKAVLNAPKREEISPTAGSHARRSCAGIEVEVCNNGMIKMQEIGPAHVGIAPIFLWHIKECTAALV